jgi:hypothetical protein
MASIVGKRRGGRVLKLDGNPLIDASPGMHPDAKHEEIEAFIDLVLGVYAGR